MCVVDATAAVPPADKATQIPGIRHHLFNILPTGMLCICGVRICV